MSGIQNRRLVDELERLAAQELRESRRELERARALVAEAVAGLAAGFRSLSASNETQAAVVRGVLASMTSVGDTEVRNLQDFIRRTSDVLQALSTFLGRIGTMSAAGMSQADASIEVFSRVTRLLQDVEGITEQSRILSVNARIEAAHAGVHGLGFKVVAASLREMSTYATKLNGQITQGVCCTRETLVAMRATLGQLCAEGGGMASLMEAKAKPLFEQMEALQERLARDLAAIEATTREVQETTGQVVQRLQFGDMVDQLFGSLLGRMDRTARLMSLMERAGSGGFPGEALAAEVAALSTPGRDCPVQQESLDEGGVELF